MLLTQAAATGVRRHAATGTPLGCPGCRLRCHLHMIVRGKPIPTIIVARSVTTSQFGGSKPERPQHCAMMLGPFGVTGIASPVIQGHVEIHKRAARLQGRLEEQPRATARHRLTSTVTRDHTPTSDCRVDRRFDHPWHVRRAAQARLKAEHDACRNSGLRGVLSRLAFRKFRVGSPIRMALVSCHDGNARQMSRT